MKGVIYLLSFFIVSHSFAESIPRDFYAVLSDSFSAEVPKGVCVLKGKAYEAWSEKGVEGGVISNLDRSRNTVTDSLGNYELELSISDTAIFFYHKKYTEIVCWKYNFQSQHVVTMNFITSEKLPDGMMYMEEKPVIYLYSDAVLNVELKLDNEKELSFTYPLYQDGWKVTTGDKGTIYIDDKAYPYLFWEGKKESLDFVNDEGLIPGYFIKTDTIVSFLENSLSELGLNQKESTDFITYWGPRLMRYDYSTVQFLVDDAYSAEIAQLTVNPRPNSKRRVYLIFEGSNKESPNYIVKKQELPSFERIGFTVIEWGGSELSPISPN
jgi:hypothetical protein